MAVDLADHGIVEMPLSTRNDGIVDALVRKSNENGGGEGKKGREHVNEKETQRGKTERTIVLRDVESRIFLNRMRTYYITFNLIYDTNDALAYFYRATI